MAYDYARLRGLIRERFGTQADFAKAIGKSPCSVSKKLNGRSEWTKDEMHKTGEVLGFTAEQIAHYFFCPKC